MSLSPQKINRALRHLRAGDPVMCALIRQVGPFRLKPERDRFGILVRSIISQQISTQAAQSIRRRLNELVAPQRPSAKNLIGLNRRRLRSAGLSPQKATYLRELCERVRDGHLRLNTIGRLSDDHVITELMQVKGIGRWTAQMFLIFSLGRLDVFPHDDLGIRSAIRHLYGLSELPDRHQSHQIAEPWRPYATVASWYCWRSIHLRRGDGQGPGGAPL